MFKAGIQDRVTGWVKYGQRWYSPTLGRWTQQDTRDAPLNPKNANRYAFAACDAINNSDPSGRDTCSQSGATTAALGVAAAGLAFWGGVATGTIAGARRGLSCKQVLLRQGSRPPFPVS